MSKQIAVGNILIKCGGSIIDDSRELSILLDNIVFLKNNGFNLMLVHGGGPDITRLCQELDLANTFIQGQRVTTPDILAVTQMALIGKVNCKLVHQLNMAKLPSLGLSGYDVNLIKADFINKLELGYVGKVRSINTAFLDSITALGITPVIAPLGVDDKGNSYNINADLAAAAIAAALKVDKLILLSDIDGFYRDIHDKRSLISCLSVLECRHMLMTNQVTGGMIPKLTACVNAVSDGVGSAHIINGNDPDGLLLLVMDNMPIGTTII